MEKEKLEQLTREYTTGSKFAFQKLFELYRKSVRGFIVSHCFGTLKQKAEDIEQETWISIWEKHEQFDTTRSFYSFVCFWANIMIKRQFSGISEHISIDQEDFNEGDLTGQTAPQTDRMSDEMEEIFKITFGKGGPPHQLIAFAFNKLLNQWKPRSIVSELAHLNLQQLTEILKTDYIAASNLPPGLVTYLFWPLTEKMNCPVDLVLDDEISRSTYRHLLDRQVGETMLNEYFGQDPVHNISDWTYKVRNRVTKFFSKKGCSSRDKISLKNVS